MNTEEVLFGLISCTGCTGFFVVIFGTVVLIRWIRHREIVTLAEKGLLPEQYAEYASAPRPQGRWFLIWGIVLAALGLALVVGLLPVVIGDVDFAPILLLGLIPLFLGLGLLIIYFVMRREESSAQEASSVEEVSPAEISSD